jgi:hypothetical protein
MEAPIPRVPPVTKATRAMFVSFPFLSSWRLLAEPSCNLGLCDPFEQHQYKTPGTMPGVMFNAGR